MKTHLQVFLLLLSGWLITFPTQLSASEASNNTSQAAIPIAANGQATGSLATDGVLWYQVTLPDDGQWKIDFKGSGNLNCNNLQLYDMSEKLIVTGSWGNIATVIYPNLEKGQYLLKLSYWSGIAASFTLTSTFINARLGNDTGPNDIIDQASALGVNSSTTGRLYYRRTDGSFDEKDWYKITTTKSGKLRINFVGDNPLRSDNLKLYDTNKTTLLATGSWGLEASVSKENLSPGTYYVYVAQYQGYGSYVVSSEFSEANLKDDIEPNDVQVNAQKINLSDSIYARIGYENGSQTDKIDWYKVTIPENGSLKFSFFSDNTLKIDNPKIYTENGIIRLTSTTWGTNFNFTASDLAKGDYWLYVPQYQGYGAYKLIAEFTSFRFSEDKEPNNTFSQAKEIVNGQTVTGNLGQWRINGDMDTQDWYKIVVPDNAAIEFTFLTDSVLQIDIPSLYATFNDTISFRNNGPTWKYNFKFNQNDLAAGTYYLKVPRYQYYGAYQLTYKLTQPSFTNDVEPNNNFRNAILLKDKDVVTGHLGFWRQNDSDRDVQDWYKIVVPDNTALEFSFITDSVLQLNYPMLYATINDTISHRNSCPYWKYNFKFNVNDLAAGTYYLKIPQYQYNGTYKLTYKLIPLLLKNDVEPNNNFRNATLLNDNQIATGHLGFWRQSEGDRDLQDWYKIVLTTKTSIDLTFLTDSVLQLNYPVLYSTDNDTIKSRNTCPNWKYNFKFNVNDLTPGTYYLKVPRWTEFGSYSISTLNPSHIIDLTQEVNLMIFPNPANDFISIQFPEAPYVGTYVVKLIGMNGSSIINETFESSQMRSGIRLSVGQFPSGQYLIRILYGNNSISRKISLK